MRNNTTQTTTERTGGSRLSDSYALAGQALTQDAPRQGLFILGKIWNVGLIKDGRMGTSANRSNLIRLVLGRVK